MINVVGIQILLILFFNFSQSDVAWENNFMQYEDYYDLTFGSYGTMFAANKFVIGMGLKTGVGLWFI